MSGKHVWPKVGWHLPGPLVARLRAHATASGESATAVVVAALQAELDRRDTTTPEQRP